MTLYLDSSAVVKLVLREAETPQLRLFLRQHRRHARVTSSLARTEVVRAALVEDAHRVPRAKQVVGALDLVDLDTAVLDAAGLLMTQPMLRSLDAIHVASALTVRKSLRALVTYDNRMRAAAESLGLPVESPA